MLHYYIVVLLLYTLLLDFKLFGYCFVLFFFIFCLSSRKSLDFLFYFISRPWFFCRIHSNKFFFCFFSYKNSSFSVWFRHSVQAVKIFRFISFTITTQRIQKKKKFNKRPNCLRQFNVGHCFHSHVISFSFVLSLEEKKKILLFLSVNGSKRFFFLL